MKKTTEFFIAQREYMGGRVGEPVWGWQDLHSQDGTKEGALDRLAQAQVVYAKAKSLGQQSKFESGRFRVVKRETTVIETVITPE